MEKARKLALLKRLLGLKHKLKVHESMKAAETHEEMSLMLLTKWEFEDEIKAIEEILSETRVESVHTKKNTLLSAPTPPPILPIPDLEVGNSVVSPTELPVAPATMRKRK